MKKSLLVISFLTVTAFAMAQDAIKQKEVGFVFSNLDNFGLTYKIGTNQSMWRFNTLFISGYNRTEERDSSEVKRISNGFNIKAGKEFRKTIAENFEFRYGVDLSFNYSYSKSEIDDQRESHNDQIIEYKNYAPGINLILGLNYIIHDKLVLGAEVMPYFSYNFGTMTDKNGTSEEFVIDYSGLSYGLSNSSAMLSVSYRF